MPYGDRLRVQLEGEIKKSSLISAGDGSVQSICSRTIQAPQRMSQEKMYEEVTSAGGSAAQ